MHCAQLPIGGPDGRKVAKSGHISLETGFSAATAKLWNVRIDLNRPQKGNLKSFLVECV